MGAQQIKLEKEPFQLDGDELQCVVAKTSKRETSMPTECRLMNAIFMNVSSVSFPKHLITEEISPVHNITVAEFAKIKTEAPSLKENYKDQNDSNTGQGTQPELMVKEEVELETIVLDDTIEETLEAVDSISIPIVEEASVGLVKKEVELETIELDENAEETLGDLDSISIPIAEKGSLGRVKEEVELETIVLEGTTEETLEAVDSISTPIAKNSSLRLVVKEEVELETIVLDDTTEEILEAVDSISIPIAEKGSLGVVVKEEVELETIVLEDTTEENLEAVDSISIPIAEKGSLGLVVKEEVELETIVLEDTTEETLEAVDSISIPVAENDYLGLVKEEDELETIVLEDTTDETLEAVDSISIPISEKGSLELHPTAKPTKLETKKELLESHGVVESNFTTVDPDDVTIQNTILPISVDSDSEAADDISCTIKTEVTDDFQIKKNLLNENIIRNSTDEIVTPQATKRKHLVKNPFSNLKKNKRKCSIKEHSPIANTKQENNLTKNVKSESIVIDSDSETESVSKCPVPSTNASGTQIILQEETKQSSINLNELIIKSENANTSDDNQEIYKSTFSNFDCLSPSLNSSLNVNTSSISDTDFKDILDVKSNISISSAAESLKYFSKIEDNVSPARNSELNKNIGTSKKRTHSRTGFHLTKLQRKEKTQKQSKTIAKTVGKKRKAKNTLAQKYKSFKVNYSNKAIFKNLPKSDIKTRQKSNKSIAKKMHTCTKEDFPKPLKLDHSSEPLQLPKPMMFKSESTKNAKNKKFYLKPEFQPCVRLKRLKSEELLVPLKTKQIRKRCQFESTTNKHKSYPQMARDMKRDFLINRAYSLNTCTNCMGHHHSYCNAQTPFNNRQMSSYSMLTNTPNQCVHETESKYFTPQELFSIFHPSTPDSTSIFSGGGIDSGVSTSTPCVLMPPTEQNKTLLLEIAAERAFINNHLNHFGYSPIQFDLFNNLNDLSIFLKYLFGNAH